MAREGYEELYDELKVTNDFCLGRLLEREGFLVTFQVADLKIGDILPPSIMYPISYPLRIIGPATREDSLRQVAITREYFTDLYILDPPDVDYGWWKCVVAD